MSWIRKTLFILACIVATLVAYLAWEWDHIALSPRADAWSPAARPAPDQALKAREPCRDRHPLRQRQHNKAGSDKQRVGQRGRGTSHAGEEGVTRSHQQPSPTHQDTRPWERWKHKTQPCRYSTGMQI